MDGTRDYQRIIDEVAALRADNMRLTKMVLRLTEALRFYADQRHVDYDSTYGMYPVIEDADEDRYGKRARAALAAAPDAPQVREADNLTLLGRCADSFYALTQDDRCMMRQDNWDNLIAVFSEVKAVVVPHAARTTPKEPTQNRPVIVCLCGSTRFWRTFQQASLAETMEGRIVLSIGAATGTDDEHFGNLPRAEYDRVKAMLDDLHLRKIDMADEVIILNCDDYVGESTGRELEYARKLGKPIRWWNWPSKHAKPTEYAVLRMDAARTAEGTET